MLKADTSEPVKRPCRSVPTDLETGTAIYNATVQRKGSLDNDCTAPPSVTCSSVLQGTVILEVQIRHPDRKRGKWDRRVGKLRVMSAVWASDKGVCTLQTESTGHALHDADRIGWIRRGILGADREVLPLRVGFARNAYTTICRRYWREVHS